MTPRDAPHALAALALATALASAPGAPAAEPDAGGAADRAAEPGAEKRADDRRGGADATRGAPAPGTLIPDGLSSKERAALEALGYMSATQAAPAQVGVRAWDAERAWNGVNLWVSAHRQVAYLMDMRGKLLHEWSFDAENPHVRERAVRRDLYPGLPELPVYFRRVHLYPNGNLLVQRDFQSLLMLDKDSNLLWEFEDATHHDVHVNPNGSIYVLTRRWRVFPWFDEKKPVADDDVVKLGPNGREIGRVSVLNAIIKGLQTGLLQELKTVYRNRGEYGIDLIHTNSIDVFRRGVPAKVPAFEPGRLLLSARSINALMVLDFAAEKIVWWTQGDFVGQHDARVLDDGSLLLFDNLGTPGASAVRELDPATGEQLWSYRGTAERSFHTMCCGTARRLPNGNTLIVETEKGRAFEVTRGGEIVWEYVSPHEIEGYGALMQDLVRLPEDPRAGWYPPDRDERPSR